MLAVGDEKFQMKCREKINDFKKSGATIWRVSQRLSIRDRAGVM
jgi:ABC-type polysaccharide/polyol phosphate transport system ATPase subunit